MLHMMVAKHGPDTCPASVEAAREKYMPYMAQIPAAAGKLGITVQGNWADMAGHTIYMVLEAPNAHAVSQMVMDLHLMDWNTIEIHPVVSVEQAAQTANARDI